MAIINQVVSGGGSAPETQYGINIKGWCGDVQNGKIRTDQAVGTLTGLSSVNQLSWNQKFMGSTGLVGSVDLSSVKFGDFRYAFQGTRITSLDLRQLWSASKIGGICYGNTALISVNLSDAFDVSEDTYGGMEHAFALCTALREIRLPSIRADSFPTDYDSGGYDYNYMDSMIVGCSSAVVHFSSSFGEDLATLEGSDKTNQFFSILCGNDGTTMASCRIVFDLPANDPFYATVQGVQKKFMRYPSHDTSSSLAWTEDGFGTVVYTSGTTDPDEGDTIYSDSSCTTSVGTISEFIPIQLPEGGGDDGGEEDPEEYEEE
jgi:hypothetical protein